MTIYRNAAHAENHYLVDFENTGDSGFYMCPALTEHDHVHIFYTENSFRLNMDFLAENKGADIQFHKVQAGKQSLDMHLISYLGYLAGNKGGTGSQFFVISADTDYDNVIDFWNDTDPARPVKRKETIRGAIFGDEKGNEDAIPAGRRRMMLNESIQKLLAKDGWDVKSAGKVCSVVCQNIDKKNGKQLILNAISSIFGEKQGAATFQKIQCVL